MAIRIAYLGDNTSHRVAVLQAAGYLVEHCGSLLELAPALDAGCNLDAVLVSEEAASGGFLALTRSCFRPPLVLFHRDPAKRIGLAFDLLIPTLHRPEVWLAELRLLIERTRADRGRTHRPGDGAQGWHYAPEAVPAPLAIRDHHVRELRARRGPACNSGLLR